MRFHVISVLPEMFDSFRSTGIVSKAIAAGTIAVMPRSPRDAVHDRHRTIDDAPYGGGSGMVMMPGPILDTIDAIEREEPEARPLRILMTPQGRPFTQAFAHELSKSGRSLTLICGRYEGVDERVREACDHEISLGDFVLMGGEVGAMAVIEAVARLLPGVLGNPASIAEESHSQGRLEYPHYTRPAVHRDRAVPDVLVSGHHAVVARWRKKKSLERTRKRRPDLLVTFPPDDEERALLAEIVREEEQKK